MAMDRERSSAESCKPGKVSEVSPVLGSTFLFRWECGGFCHAYSAFLAVAHCIKIHQTTGLVDMKCLVKDPLENLANGPVAQ